jgi:hypothetical protein
LFKRFGVVLAGVILMLAGFAAPANAATTYYYAGTGQSGFGATEPTSVFANVSALNPTLDCTGPDWENHTLIEMAMIQGSGVNRQIAEVGLRKACGDAGMKVLGYFWRNGVACGYSLINLCGTTHDFNECNTVGGVNNCGQSTDNWNLGSTVASGTVMRLGIHFTATDIWFLVHQSGGTPEYLGWLDKTFYTGAGITFDSADEVQFFGETAPGGGSLGCTDMGTGSLPSAPANGAVIGSATYLPAGITVDIDASATYVTDSSKYNALVLGSNPANNRSMLISGPGAC